MFGEVLGRRETRRAVITDLLTGTATAETIGFAGRVLVILLAMSFALLFTHKWTPRWCHWVAEHVVLLAWVVWGGVCVWFRWEFIRQREADGLTPDQIERQFGGNVLGYFGLAIAGAAFAMILKWLAWRERRNHSR